MFRVCLYYLLWYLLCILAFIKIYSILTQGRCRSFTCLLGKTAIVTGGNRGMGYQVALNLAARGCRVIVADIADTTNTRQQIISKTDNKNVIGRYLNLGSFKSVREFADYINRTEPRLDYLINNAGIGCSAFKKTEDGLPDIIQINFLGHFLLTHLLIDLLKKSAPSSKIIFTSSFVSIFGRFSLDELFSTEFTTAEFLVRPYGISKFAINIASFMFAEKLKYFGITCNTLHPGIVQTNIFNNNFNQMKGHSKMAQILAWMPAIPAYLFGKRAEQGAQTILHMVCSKETDSVSGKFFADCKYNHWMSWVSYRMDSSLTQTFKNDFWCLCEKLVKLQDSEKLLDVRESDFG